MPERPRDPDAGALGPANDSTMARRTKEEAAITREQLLDAAERVFRERGVTHTSLAEVAAAAGVTRGAVYWHFRDKADVFNAMCERAHAPDGGQLAPPARSAIDDPLGALRARDRRARAGSRPIPRTQAVFDVVFHKCEFTAELAAIASAASATDHACLRTSGGSSSTRSRAGQLPRTPIRGSPRRRCIPSSSGSCTSGCSVRARSILRAPRRADRHVPRRLRVKPPRRVDEYVRPRASPRAAVA